MIIRKNRSIDKIDDKYFILNIWCEKCKNNTGIKSHTDYRNCKKYDGIVYELDSKCKLNDLYCSNFKNKRNKGENKCQE